MDGRWRSVGGDDSDDPLQFSVPEGGQNGVSGPEIGFSVAAAFWSVSGAMVVSPSVFRSKGVL